MRPPNFRGHLEGLRSIGGDDDLVSALGQDPLDDLAQVVGVLYHEDRLAGPGARRVPRHSLGGAAWSVAGK